VRRGSSDAARKSADTAGRRVGCPVYGRRPGIEDPAWRTRRAPSGTAGGHRAFVRSASPWPGQIRSGGWRRADVARDPFHGRHV